MHLQSFFIALLTVCLGFAWFAPWSQAADIDDYVVRYLKATEPVPIAINSAGETELFSPQTLTEGKRIFEENCKNCHVGGATVPNPVQSLSLENLKGAIPPRDNLASLIAFQREPMTYDGEEISFWCRQVPDTWLPDEELAKVEAFILRAAQVAKGWGTEQVDPI
ncbi:MAG: photosystem II cytochrome PsbV2 [Acaryochloridaceae cyanobacterium CSU_5_19]|nr:photosystem II cytochrome PsbV2 [Acaryochloridaceae cyanobacterium CSU_5_19]